MSLIDQVFAAGVVGAGGAGFPTHKKLAANGVNLLVVNAAECEPLLASDRYVMRHHADQVVSGLASAAQTLGVDRVVIGTKAKYAAEIAALRAAIQQAGQDFTIHGVDSFYPAGDEQVLIYEITGQTVPPGGIPLDLGIVVINVTTAMNIHQATQSNPVTRHFVTVTGEVANPCVVDAPVGATASQLIAAAGGALTGPFAMVRGGPMMGRHHAGAEAEGLGYGKADGGLIVLPASHPLVEFCSQGLDQLLNQTKSACIQCQLCTDMCPRYLIGHQMRPHRVMRALGTNTGATDLLDALLCCECGICELFACPMGLSPRRMNIYVKSLLRADGVTRPAPGIYPEYTRERDYRRIAQSRFIDRWQLNRYPTHLDNLVHLDASRVILAMRHGVGQAAQPCVAVGDTVRVGQVVGQVTPDAVGALVHASIDGVVATVTDQTVTIETKGAVK